MPSSGRQLGGNAAALVAGWNRWRTGFSPPQASPLGGEIPGTIKVELYISEAWVDITRLDQATPGVYYRDSITITRGKADEDATLDRSTCRFTLNNRDGRFSPRNPMSPYYGKIGRNTPVRVSVVQANGERRYRFYGEVSSWPQKWDTSGTDVYVRVEAAGILRRLGQGASPTHSPLYRGATRYTDHLVAYWPCEDVSGSTSIASATSGVKAMSVTGTPTLASDSTSFSVSSDPLPVMGSGSFTATVPNYSTSLGQHVVRFVMSVPSAGATNGQIICSINATGGSVTRWELYYGTGGTLGLRGFDPANASVGDTGAVAFAVNGAPLRVSVELLQTTATTASFTIATLAAGATSASTSGASGTLTIGRITGVILASNSGLTTTTLGHLTVQNIFTTLFDLALQQAGYSGETAGTRIARLCAEEGINYLRKLPVATSMTMGVQPTDTLVNLIRECVTADMGRLSEPRDQVGFNYRDRASLYDQTAVLALDYSAANLSDSLDPVDDDQFTRNDITVNRTNGSSVRVTRATGALSIASVGRYDESVTVNVQTDTQLPDIAGWLLHLGTLDEARYPTISLNLAHSTFTSSSALTTAALVLDIGDRVTIANPPAWLPPDQISLIVEGYTEMIGGNGQQTLVVNCSPESAHHIAVYNDSTWRYESNGSTLAADTATTSTSLSVATTSGPLWSANDGSFDINIGGERMTVTSITGSTSPQTFTVTRSVNGIVKVHYAGDAVSLFKPAFYAI